MALTDDQLAAMRAWVGDEPTDDELDDRYTRLGSYDQVVIETINRKLALFAEQPSSLSVPGLSISFGEAISSLKDALKRFIAVGGLGLDTTGSVGFSITRIQRTEMR